MRSLRIGLCVVLGALGGCPEDEAASLDMAQPDLAGGPAGCGVVDFCVTDCGGRASCLGTCAAGSTSPESSAYLACATAAFGAACMRCSGVVDMGTPSCRSCVMQQCATEWAACH